MAEKEYIIIPAFNEGKILGKVLYDLRQATNSSIVVVDDGSIPELNRLHGIDDIYWLRHRINMGQGAALATGIVFALKQGAELFITFDADGQHSADDIDRICKPVRSGEVDIVFGSRFLNKQNKVPWGKRILILGGRILHLLFTGFWMTDAHNGLRAFNRKAALCLQLKENRMAHATEIVLNIKRFKLKWKEMPVQILYTDYSTSKGQSMISSIRILFDVVLHKLFR